MAKLTGTKQGDAANLLFAFYADKAHELEELGQYFMPRSPWLSVMRLQF
jgi:hypothetical protein